MREAPLNLNEIPGVELPEYLKGVSLHDLNELCANSTALNGLWEKSKAATDIHEHQLCLASGNEEHAKHLKNASSEIVELRKQVNMLTDKEEAAQEHWQRAEARMRAAIEPYSPAGVKRAIEKEVAELEKSSGAVEEKFRNGLAADEDPIALARQYVLERRQRHYDQTLLDSLS